MKKHKFESIPLIVYENETGKVLVDIEVEIEGQVSRFLFDTGAAKSQIKFDDVTKNFKQIGQKESKGASGVGLHQDLVEIPSLAFGETVFRNLVLARSHRGIFGIDLLENRKIEIDLKNNKLNFVEEVVSQDRINWLKRGHLTIPLKISNTSTFCLFDTGADSTLIDERFVKDNSDKFELIGAEEGEDAHGHKIPSRKYNCKEFELGHLNLKNVEMSGFEFGEHMREAMEGVPIILGNNIIYGSVWSFDFEAGIWSSWSNL